MISVLIDRDEISLAMDGHAGYADAGSDIVCAAASILVYTFASRLREITGGDGLYASLAPGEARVKVDADWRIAGECTAVLDTITAGFMLLADKYPDHVSVVLRGG